MSDVVAHAHCAHLIGALKHSGGVERFYRCCHCGDVITERLPPADEAQWTDSRDLKHGQYVQATLIN